MNFAANLTMLFTEYDFLDRFEKAYKYNFKAVEYLFPYDYNPQELKNLNKFYITYLLEIGITVTEGLHVTQTEQTNSEKVLIKGSNMQKH